MVCLFLVSQPVWFAKYDAAPESTIIVCSVDIEDVANADFSEFLLFFLKEWGLIIQRSEVSV